ncbi:hypothetical protein GVX76_06970 [[Haemophilus] felis]|nr:hypothetical protein [[Haemophilus] felis]
MENLEHQDFDADAAFDEAAETLEKGELTADNTASDAEETNQDTSDQGEQSTQEQAPDLPDWLANATDDVKQRFRELEADNQRYQHQARSQTGRVGALTKKYQQQQAENERLRAELEQIKQSNQPHFEGELSRLRDDYPDIAALLEKMIAHQEKRIGDVSKPLESMTEANMRNLAQQELDNSIEYVTQLIPDAEQILSDPQFSIWLDKQPSGVRSMFTSDDPNDAIYLLKEFKNAMSLNADRKAKQTQQLSALSLPNGRNAPKGGDEIDEDLLFDRIANEMKKQRY